MLLLRKRPPEYLARPGQPAFYDLHNTARLLQIGAERLEKMIKAREIRAKKSPIHGRGGYARWQIPRSEVVRIARKLYSDRPLKLARILASPKLRPVAITNDLSLRKLISHYNPVYCSSPFALGQHLSVQATNLLVIDWETTGTMWARDIAERLVKCPDRPKIVGILPEFQNETNGCWDALVPRPYRGRDLLSTLLRLK